MIETALVFGLALLVILLAQFGERSGWARRSSYILLLAAGLLTLLAGVAMTLQPGALPGMDGGASAAAGWAIMLTGLLICLLVAAGMRASRGGKTPALGNVPWWRPPHLTAWTMLLLFIGSNLALTSLQNLSSIEIENPLALIAVQGVAFTLAALLGTGWGVRRSWDEVCVRLGLQRPSLSDFRTGIAMAVIMLISTGLLGALIQLVFQQDVTAASGFNEQIIAHLPGAPGVLVMGLATGLGEEMLYRGALQPAAGIWLTSLLFSLSHIQYLSPVIVVVFALGLLLGYTRNRWGLTTAIWAHAVYNILVGLLAMLAMQAAI